MRRDPDELDGFLEFLAAEISHEGLRALVQGILGDARDQATVPGAAGAPDSHHVYAGGLLEHTVGVATICRELRQLHPRLRADLAPHRRPRSTTSGARVELEPGPGFRQTAEGRLLGHVHLGTAPDRGARRGARPRPRARSYCTRSPSHHDARAAKTAEAAVLYHANQLDAVAATRPVDGT